MENAATKIVAYDPPNVMKCLCGQCHVQADSTCVPEKMRAISGTMEEMKRMMGSGGMTGGMSGSSESMMPPKGDLPGLYCATGTAACPDLDFSKACMCPSCQVWSENRLENRQYCRQGSAAEVG